LARPLSYFPSLTKFFSISPLFFGKAPHLYSPSLLKRGEGRFYKKSIFFKYIILGNKKTLNG